MTTLHHLIRRISVLPFILFLTSAKYEGGIYTLSVERTIFGKYKYVDYTKIIRITGTVLQ